ncbi:YodL domain-containing protein [Butyricicoccus faecihominis]|uniref:YodL domain-containing protein n=1 Tax=Butyricicoccus faecihominis TaxID=1712515 RepID=UPI0024787A53|nr:YodL domain-containing protein [Butyricicoccus faecihominis]MCQ5129473.1 YodL domain-containing protein [Butyricicoccus faecihominis]
MPYSSYDRDTLEPASTMRIERNIYFESGKSDISELAALPLERLQQMREESAAAEQEVFDRLKAQAAAWEEQAGKTLFLDKAIEYVRTPQATHTANQWETPDEYRHIRSNAVYQMSYSISENTRYDSTAKKSIPYSWTLRWSIFTNGPGDYQRAKIAGQDRKVFASREELDKYLNGRIKAYEHLFTETFPAIPQEYADCFKVNGCLLPGYTIEGQQAETKIDKAAEKDAPEPPLSAPVSERSDRMSEVFSIQLHNRQLYEQSGDGVWLDLPTTTEKLQAALREIGITADNPQDFFINGYSYPEDRHLALPYEMVLHSDVDELNFLAARLETLDDAALAELNAALQNPKGGFENIGQIIDYPDNVDYYVHLPDVQTPSQLGDYYLNRSGMVEMPEEWKGGIDPARFGQHVAGQEQGVFTEYGYLVKSGDEWQRVHEGQPVPEEYRVMAYPAPDVLREESKAQPAPERQTAEAPPPVVPIILNGQNSADRMKEITDRLETGIQELFESERYKAYLTSMSRFHSYSFNNTLLIAMQGGQLVAGYNKWRDEFHRNVKRGEKGIKILAPAPFKTKKEVPKLDEHGQPVIGKDGRPVTETKEVQIPAFKVVSVFDVSQTEGEPLPSLAVDELAGSVEDYQDFFKALEQTSPVPVAFEDIPGSSHGYYHLTEKRIAIQDGMSELQTLKTAIHEIAHAKLHAIDPEAPTTEQANRPDSRTREVQAESVAYAVCQHYGLDTSDYSFGYVAGWSSGRDLKELKASLETIRATAHELITAIDGHLAELQQQRQAQQTAEPPGPPTVERAAEQPDPDSVFSKLSPEQQREMTDSVKDMLQSLVEADLKSKGTVSQGTLEAIQTQGFVLAGDGKLEKAPEQNAVTAAPLTDLQKKAVQISNRYKGLPLQAKIDIIAQAFGCKTGKIETSPCTGKWRGTSDISIRFDNGVSLFIGNHLTPKAKIAKVQTECVNSALVQYNPEIVRATKEAALPVLLQREAKDNEIAAQKGLKPYTILNVEFNDGADDKNGGYMGWYYVTLAVDGKICAHMETGLNHAIADGKVSETPTRENYFAAGALKETDVDYVFNNVGFSSASDLYSLHIPEDVRERAEKALAEREQTQNSFSIYQLKDGPETRDYRFEPYDRLQAAGLAVDRQNYNLIYTAPLDGKTTLEDIYRTFNIDHPADFTGHSLSVSDIVVLNRSGKQEAHYCDSFGFQDVPEFFIQREKQLTPDALLTGESIQTPRGSFHVTDMSREQMEAAGYGFHHQSEDGQYLIMGNSTQAFAILAQQESPIKAAEMTTEQNTNMIDGVLNNAPTMGELEAKVKAGKQVSLLDVAEAAKAEAVKSGQRHKAPQEKQKPSIRAQLKAAKEEQAKKPPAREKSKELEV